MGTLVLLEMLPENWVCLFLGVEPIDTIKPKKGKRRDLLLLAYAVFSYVLTILFCEITVKYFVHS